MTDVVLVGMLGLFDPRMKLEDVAHGDGNRTSASGDCRARQTRLEEYRRFRK